MNYYPFHVGDYIAHTAHLDPLEDIAYRRLLDLYYMQEQPLPADHGKLARLIRMRDYVEVVSIILDEFFLLTDEGWRHDRCDCELEKIAEKSQKARESAAASVNARKVKSSLNERSTNAQRTVSESPTNVELPNTQYPIPKECVVTPLSPQPGSREDGTNPRATGENLRATGNNPRALGTNPRVADQFCTTFKTREESAIRRGQLACLLRDRGVEITSGHPDLCQWVESGLTDNEAIEAVDRARINKPPPSKIPAKYLAAIVPKVIADRDAPSGPLPRSSPSRKSGGFKSVEQQNREAAARAKVMLFGDKSDVIEGEVVHGGA